MEIHPRNLLHYFILFYFILFYFILFYYYLDPVSKSAIPMCSFVCLNSLTVPIIACHDNTFLKMFSLYLSVVNHSHKSFFKNTFLNVSAV